MQRSFRKALSVLLSVLMVLSVFGGLTLTASAADVWDGTWDGSGFSNNHITSAKGFAQFINNAGTGTSYEGQTIYLDVDVDFNSIDFGNISGGKNVYYSRDNYFKGTFDGQNHTIYNFQIHNSDHRVGLFRSAENATFRNVYFENVLVDDNSDSNKKNGFAALVGWGGGNLTFKNIKIKSGEIFGYNYVGGIVGEFDSNSTIRFTDCSNAARIYANNNRAAGLVGHSKGSVIADGCSNSGEVYAGYSDAGGIAGWIEDDESSFTNCSNTGKISTDACAGGIFGYFGSKSQDKVMTITNCSNSGYIESRAKVAGGIAGMIDTDGEHIFEENVNRGAVYGREDAGGIVGSNSGFGTWRINYNYGSVTCPNDNAGGILGEVEDDKQVFKNCFNSGAVQGKNSVGGILGYGNAAPHEFSKCGNSGDVTSTNDSAGGIYGYGGNSQPTIETCWNVGTIKAYNDAGGILGHTNHHSFIRRCWNAGSIETYNHTDNGAHGGIVGHTSDLSGSSNDNPNMTDCYNWGQVSGGRDDGGLIGKIRDGNTSYYITNSYNAGAVSGVRPFAIIAYGGNVGNNVYYDSGVGMGTVQGTAISDANLKASSGFSSNYCKNTWGVKIGGTTYYYPIMQWYRDMFYFTVWFVDAPSGTNAYFNGSYGASCYTPAPTRTGYTPGFWFLSDDMNKLIGRNTYFTCGVTAPSDTFTVEQHLDDVTKIDVTKTFNMTWTPNRYTIRFDRNGMNYGSMEDLPMTYDIPKDLPAVGFFREFTVKLHYNDGVTADRNEIVRSTFNGWAKSAGGAKVYDDKAQVNNLAADDGVVVTLYAKWTAGSLTLTDLEREGYDFEGWYTDEALTQKVTGAYTPTANSDLYAKWAIKTFTVVFRDQDDLQVGDEQTVAYGQDATPPEPPRDFFDETNHFVFKGWTDYTNITEDTVVQALYFVNEHVFDQEIASDDYKASDATCNAPAKYYKSCVCGYKGTETFDYGEVDGTNHVHTENVTATDSTCTTPGYTAGVYCSDCGQFISGHEPKALADHVYTGAPVWSAWSETADGWTCAATFKCDNCTNTIAPEVSITSATTDPTCDTAGFITYTASVTNNGTTYTNETTKVVEGEPATGHVYTGEPVWSNWTGLGDNWTCVATFKCDNCTNTISPEVTVSSVPTDPTCEEAGFITFTATVVNNGTTYQNPTDKVLEGDPATGHSYATPEEDDWSWEPAGDTYVASVTLSCVKGDHSEIVSVGAVKIAETPAGHLTPGSRTFEAMVTIGEQVFTAQKIDVLEAEGHSTVFQPAAASTRCDQTGTIAYYSCAGCDLLFADEDALNEITDIDDHTYGPHSYTDENPVDECLNTPATCITPATYFKSCMYCGRNGTETFEFGGVDLRNHATTARYTVGAVEPGYTFEGYTGDKYCSACDNKTDDGDPIDRLRIADNAIYQTAVATQTEAAADPDKYDANDVAALNGKLSDLTAALAIDDNEEAVLALLGELETILDGMDAIEWVTVTFIANGETVSTKRIRSGESATAPEVPAYIRGGADGHQKFVRWVGTYTNVTADVTITAEYVTENHVWQGGNVALTPTCSEKGSREIFCVCGAESVGVLDKDPNNHADYGTKVVNAVTARCDRDGYTGDTVCAGCGKVFESGTVIPKATVAHTPGEPVVTTAAATCGKDGSRRTVVTCSVCGETISDETETLPATGEHTPGAPVETILREATCTAKGRKLITVSCSVCGEPLSETTEDIPMIPHDLQHVSASEATCGESGNIEYWVCARCGKYFSDAAGENEITKDDTFVPATEEHDLEYVPAKEATDDEDGNIEYWYCADCDGYFADAEGKTRINRGDTVLPAKNAGHRCLYCGQVHTGFWGTLLWLIHSFVMFFITIFGLRK